MKCFVGIDLGSTTTKAVLMDDNGEILGRGITNSRSNYDTASRAAKLEAHISTRLTLIRRALVAIPAAAASDLPPLSSDLHGRLEQLYEQQVKEHIRGLY